MEQLKYADIIEIIIGCAMEVHRALGNGFQEFIYQKCLSIELSNRNLKHEIEKEMPIWCSKITI